MSENYVRSWNRKKENKKSEAEPKLEPCQKGMVRKHCNIVNR
jgi:hypothetical protein